MTTVAKAVKLIMVTTDNNNKFYDMTDNGNGTFTVSYGRVGGRATVASYPIGEWGTKYREKTKKGYADQTHLFVEEGDKVDLVDINDPAVKDLIEMLMTYAKNSISSNYTVSADQVTKKQVTEAQAILDALVKKVKKGMKVEDFNKGLLDLYKVIPRKMKNVNDHLFKEAKTKEDIETIQNHLGSEQDTLDVMSGQVQINEKKKEATKDKTVKVDILQTMGLEMSPVTDDKVIKMIKGLMQDESSKFHRAFTVTNKKTQKAYDEWFGKQNNKKVELFWHGSRSENWMSILETGLVLRPASAIISGKMFGFGLYFADKFRKSLNYTSLRGSYWAKGSDNKAFLALFDVHVGNQFCIKKHQSWCYELSAPNLKKQQVDADSLFAEGGADLVNNEYIVYEQSQCTVKYIVEVHA